MIVHWPAGIARHGEFVTTPAHIVDILPTCAALAGAQRPAEIGGTALAPLSGQSLVPLFQSGTLAERTLFWTYSKNRAIRIGLWKLVSALGRPWELYNMEADRSELNNLATQEPQRVTALATAWERLNAGPLAPGARKKR